MQIWVGRGNCSPAFSKILANLGITWVIRIKNAVNKKTTTIIGYVKADLISDLT